MRVKLKKISNLTLLPIEICMYKMYMLWDESFGLSSCYDFLFLIPHKLTVHHPNRTYKVFFSLKNNKNEKKNPHTTLSKLCKTSFICVGVFTVQPIQS